MGLPCVELATLTRPDNFCGVCHDGWPVETLSKDISFQRPRRCVIATSPQVNLPKEIRALLVGDAPHEDARGAAFVHLTVDKDKSLGAASQPPCLG